MSLFNLAHTRGNPCQDLRSSLGVHMAPSGEPCSQYRDPNTGDIVHVIDRVENGVEVEARAIGACPTLNLAAAVPNLAAAETEPVLP